jgi:Uma2 family endonuclease
MAVPGVVLTYEDYAAMPSDGRRYELHEGEIVMSPGPTTGHQRSSGRLGFPIHGYVESHELGELFFAPIDVILDSSTVVQPDLVFVARDRLHFITERAIEGPPTLVIEILSPGSERIDTSVKFQLYARFGVPYYWIVSREARSIRCYRLEDGAYVLDGELRGDARGSLEPFPDLVLDAGPIFA